MRLVHASRNKDEDFGRRSVHSPRASRKRITESNIRRTFTVRFPNLYCVWQQCRDIRGSYRNVLLLIVLHPEGSGGRERRVASAPNEDGKSGKRDAVREDERQKRVVPGVYIRKREKREKGRKILKGGKREKIERERANASKTGKERKGKRTIREHSVHWCF